MWKKGLALMANLTSVNASPVMGNTILIQCTYTQGDLNFNV